MDVKFYRHICANECRNTHHKLAMNALQHLKCSHANQWQAIFVRYFEQYLTGSKAPDKEFKDFRNHVLHVSDNFWGGAVKEAEAWYGMTIEALRSKNWREACYAAGVLSHYYMDPLMPLHTGQTEEEGVMHRACEWSVNKSFSSLIEQLESTTGYPEVQLGKGNDWLKETVRAGAIKAHGYYQDYIDHYDPVIGARKPEEGLDDHLREITAQLLGYASVGFARILDRAIEESGAAPQKQQTLLWRLFYKMTLPVSWTYSTYRHFTARSRVSKIAKEYRLDGKVVDSLTTDDKTVRKRHAEEVLKIEMNELDAMRIEEVGSKHVARKRTVARSRTRPNSSAQTFRLDVSSELEDAPSIGPKTAARFAAIGISTVGQFLQLDPATVVAQLQTKHVREETIRTWQAQARLACQIPKIYGHDAQILVACGFDSPEEIAQTEPEEVLSLVDEFAKTTDAKFVIRGKQPDMAEVENWVQWAAESRSLDAA